MHNNFEIVKLNNEPYDFLILATSYENPLNDIYEIGERLKIQKAKLLFDLTLINGTSQNRYIECDYTSNKGHLPTCSIVNNINDSIKKISQSFFVENEEMVQNSVLPSALKYLLKAGVV